MANGDLFRAQVRMNVSQSPASFFLGYVETSSNPPATQDSTGALAIAVAQQLNGLTTVLSEQTQIEAVRVRLVGGTAQPPSTNYLVDVNGAVSGQALPATKAVLISHKQQQTNIRSNGKTYLPGTPEAGTEGDRLIGGGLEAIVKNVFDSLLSLTVNVGGDQYDYTMVILQRAQGGGPPANAWPVTSNSVSSILYNQARRRTREFGLSAP